MKGKEKSIANGKIITIIIAAVVALVFTAVIITDMYVPVIYLSAYVVTAQTKQDGDLTVAFLDVGYGDCIVVQLPDGKNMLIDGGDGVYNHSLSILTYLNANGIEKIDYLVCSSVRAEHCGGLTEILKYKEVEKAYIPYCKNKNITTEYGEFYTALNESKIAFEYTACGLGVANEDYGYFFTFLSPSDYNNPNSEYADMNSDASKVNINNASAVMWLQYKDQAFAFTSDAGQASLENITESYKLCKEAEQPFCPVGNFSVELEKCTVAQAAGHGGDKCTYSDWYDTLSAQKVIISVGKNYADCPSLAALSDITNSNAEVLITDESGNIKITRSAEN